MVAMDSPPIPLSYLNADICAQHTIANDLVTAVGAIIAALFRVAALVTGLRRRREREESWCQTSAAKGRLGDELPKPCLQSSCWDSLENSTWVPPMCLSDTRGMYESPG